MNLPSALGVAAIAALGGSWLILRLLFSAGQPWCAAHLSANALSWILFLLIGVSLPLLTLSLILSFVSPLPPCVWSGALICCSNWFFCFTSLFPSVQSNGKSDNRNNGTSSYISPALSSRLAKLFIWLAVIFGVLALLSAALSSDRPVVLVPPVAPLTNACSLIDEQQVCTSCFNFTKLSDSFCRSPTDHTYLRTLQPGTTATKEDVLAMLQKIDKTMSGALPVLAVYARANLTDLRRCYAHLFEAMCEYYFPICSHSCEAQKQCAETCVDRYGTCRGLDFALGELSTANRNSFFTSIIPDETQRNQFYKWMESTPLCEHECKYVSLASSTNQTASCNSAQYYDFSQGSCSVQAEMSYQQNLQQFEIERNSANRPFPTSTFAFSVLWASAMCILFIHLCLFARNPEKEFDVCQRPPELLVRAPSKTASLKLISLVSFCCCVCFSIGVTLFVLASKVEEKFLKKTTELSPSSFSDSPAVAVALLVLCGCVCLVLATRDLTRWKTSLRDSKQSAEGEDAERGSAVFTFSSSGDVNIWQAFKKFRSAVSLRGSLFRYRIILMELIEIITQLIALQVQLANVHVTSVIFVVTLISLNLACFGFVQFTFDPVCAVVLDVIFDSLYLAVSLASENLETNPTFAVALALALPACLVAQAAHHPSLDMRQNFANAEIVLSHRKAISTRTERQDGRTTTFSGTTCSTIWQKKHQLLVIVICIVLGSFLFGSTISRIRNTTEQCRTRVGAEIWGQIPSPTFFAKNGFYGEMDCGFDSITSLQVDNMHITSLPGSAFEANSLGSLTSLDLLRAPSLNNLPESLLQHLHITSLILAPNSKITLNISRKIIPNRLVLIAPFVQHINASFSSADTTDSILQALSNSDFPRLESLDLSSSKMQQMSPIWERAPLLSFVDCSNNMLTNFPGISAWWNSGSEKGEIKNLTLLAKGNPLFEIEWSSLNEVPAHFFEQFVFPNSPLKSVRLSFGNFTEFPEIIFDLDLRILTARGGSLSTLSSSIGKCKNLTLLDLSYTELTALPSSLSGLTKLQQLDISFNDFDEVFPPIVMQLPWIQILFANRVDERTDVGIAPMRLNFSEFFQLSTLIASHAYIESIPNTTSHIACYQCDNFVPTFGQLPSLRVLAAEGWEQFNMASYPNLEILVLKNCSVVLFGNDSFSSLMYLELDIDANTLTASLPSLRSVRFTASATGIIPTDFWGAEARLVAVSFPEGMSSIPSVTNLTQLAYFHTTQNFSTTQVNEVLNLPRIVFAHLPRTNFSQLPSNISSSLCVLIIDKGAHPVLSYAHLSCSVGECNADDSRCFKNTSSSNSLVCTACSHSCFSRFNASKTLETEALQTTQTLAAFSGVMPSLFRKSAFEQACGYSYSC